MAMSADNCCGVCGNTFKRLESHLRQSLACKSYYMYLGGKGAGKVASSVSFAGNIQIESSKIPKGVNPPLFSDKATPSYSSQPQQSRHRAVSGSDNIFEDDVALEYNLDEDLDSFVFDDACDDVMLSDAGVDDDSDLKNGEMEAGPDVSVLDRGLKLLKMQANPFGLARFSLEETVQIELLDLLRKLNCHLKAFPLLLKWAAKANARGYIFREGSQPTREKVISTLYERYNMSGLTPQEKQLYLPYTKRIVSVVYFNASDVFASLLTCPTLNQDDNYFFHEARDPFVSPQQSADIGDIHTGLCYSKTYEALIKQRGVDMLFPCVMAMDKTHVDMAGRLQMEPITISHGLLKNTKRRLPSAMRILGYINHSTPTHFPSSAEADLEFNNPADLPKGVARVKDPLPPTLHDDDISWSTLTLNEMHMQIEFILEASGYLELQKHGFRWNLQYNGTTHEIVFHPYVPFIIGDTEGHDRLCGHYTARFSQVQQLCRICECPTYLTGYSKSKFPYRTPRRIGALVQKGLTHELQLQSQNYLKSGFTRVRFGQHNTRGIFGACPGEMLHLISLGWFKYCLQSFAAQAGPKSSALKEYDHLCANLGETLARQSDRDMPRTNFPKGFSSATNLMGHEMTGCLLVQLFAMHTTCFQEIFGVGKKVSARRSSTGVNDQRLHFENHVDDWKLLVTSLLAWHQWMKQPVMSKKNVKRSHVAVQWLMRVSAEVAPRPGAMGNNTIKRHLVLHLSEDIMDHGVPENVNSSYAESAHISLAKVTSRNTQKRATSFTKQAAHRYVENLCISLAATDVEKESAAGIPPGAFKKSGKGGRGFTITWETGVELPTSHWNNASSTCTTSLLGGHVSPHVMDFLCCHCLPKMKDNRLPCFTLFTDDKGDKYRAHPCYLGKSWNDFAMVKWAGYDHNMPAFIHTFVDLSSLQAGEFITIKSNGQTRLGAGMYAVAHSFDPIPGDHGPTDFIWNYTPYFQSVHEIHPTLFLVDVHSIVSPIVGIEDIIPFGMQKPPVRNRCYLFLIQRKQLWPKAWDSMIETCYNELQKDEDDDTWFEEEYEKPLVIKRLQSGRELFSVKTAEDFSVERAVAKKKKEDAAAEKAVAKAAKAVGRASSMQPAMQPPEGGQQSKRKRVTKKAKK